MEAKIQKWRDYFAECQIEQLRDFPLHEPKTPAEHAQYKISLSYVQAMSNQDFARNRVIALSADETTRRAFFDSFKVVKYDWFCFRSEGYHTLTSKWRRGSGMWPFQMRYHEWSECVKMQPNELRQRFGEGIENLDAASLYLRRHGFRDASRAGLGGSDLWQWNGTALIQLSKFNSRWVS